MAPGWTGIVFVALCLLWHLCSGVSPEVKVFQPQSSVTADAGDSVTLNCNVSRQALGPVKWSRGTGPQKQQLDIKPAETPGHISWAIAHLLTENDKSIVISELSLRDSGVYYCEWYRPSQNQPNASGSGTTLTVRGKPIITPPAERASLGERVTLSCESEGAGNTPLSWDRDGQSQTGVQERHLTDRSRSSLTLTAAPSFITSTVRCLIPPATGKDTPVSTALQLRDFITVPPAVKVTGQTQLVLGQSASLTCQLSGFYPASWTLQWLLNDKTLGPQAGTQISRTEPQPSEEGTFTQSSLVQLTGSLELRAAALVCQAEFEGKHSERDSITLRVRGSPHITAPEKRVKAGDDLTLSCESVGDTDTPLSWRVGMKNMSGEQSHLPSSSFQGTSSSLTLRADKSFIRETVFCEIPETDLSASLRLESVLTVPPAVKVTGQTQLVLGQSASLTCQLSGFYPASWTLQWLLNDKTLGPQAGKQISRTEPQPSEEGTFTQSSLVQLTGILELRAAALVCQAEFKGKHTVRDSITLRVRGSPHITAPEKRVKADDLTLSCESVGDTDTPLSWRVGMKNMSGEQSHLPSSSFQGTSSSLTLRADKSFIRETVFCEIPETNLSASLRLESVLTVVPTVKIKSQNELFLNQTVNISCLVSGFFPHNVSVSWEPMTLSRTPVQDQNCTKIQNQDGTYTAELWAWFLFTEELNGSAVSCVSIYEQLWRQSDNITLRERKRPENIPDTRQQDEGPSTVLLYAGVACGIILFLVTVALLMYCKRRGEQHKPEDSSPADGGAVLREPEITYAALDMKKLKPKAAPPAGQDRTGQGEDPTEVTYAALDLKRLPKPRAAPPAGEESTVYAEVKGARGRKAISEPRTPPASLASESTEYASINFRRKTRRGQDSVLYY
ncbi:hemicentin-2-like [Lepisosteus oculatus]|uniref:hemicentin-2-like n=1 Tax=Lepisosteus oculatus TaxID=7918 RepID=UPI0037125DE9